jgi:hypothetical protein
MRILRIDQVVQRYISLGRFVLLRPSAKKIPAIAVRVLKSLHWEHREFEAAQCASASGLQGRPSRTTVHQSREIRSVSIKEMITLAGSVERFSVENFS